MKKQFYILIALILILVGGMISSSMGSGIVVPKADYSLRPLIFVHGYAGSGAQFGSQAQRFTSNDYPAEHIAVFEYDSTLTINTMEQVYANLDAKIDNIQEETGFEKVDVLGHSMGTTVMHGYLAYPDRAANVAHYVNIDGRSAPAPPGGVPTLAIWAGLGTHAGDEIIGAINVTIPNQTHVQVATSKETFAEIYQFLAGKIPAAIDIIPDPPGKVRLAGRAIYFPLNIGLPNATLEIWEVDADTGERAKKKPKATIALGLDGSFGPIKAEGGNSYEFAVAQESTSGTYTHHFYFEPFFRSDYLIRLTSSPRGTGISAFLDTSDNHTNMIVQRYKEFWGDQGAEDDVLLIDGASVLNPATCPFDKRVIAMFLFDRSSDGISHLFYMDPVFTYPGTHFMSGADLYIPGVNPPDDTVQVMLIPRNDADHTQVINALNWASSEHTVSTIFNDYVQDINSFPEWAKSKGE